MKLASELYSAYISRYCYLDFKQIEVPCLSLEQKILSLYQCVTLIAMSFNKNCFLFQVLQRRSCEDGHQKRRQCVKNVSCGSSIIVVGNMFSLVNSLAATPLFPHVSSVARARAVRSRGLFAAGSDSCTSPRFAERPC
jgi:hypothetical protein